jgi:hypothetical protein
MKRVTGIGGIFFKANDPDKWRDWYRVHLGIECEKEVGAIFKWRRADDIAAFIIFFGRNSARAILVTAE